MKKLTIICSFALLIVSCSKKETTTAPATTTTTPSPNAGNVDGALVSLKIDVSNTSHGYSTVITTENALATFFAATGNSNGFVEGGTISVNGTNLDKQSNNSYLKSASIGQTPSDLNFSSNDSKWVVGGTGTVPSFSYNHNVAFPAYTGTIPDAITRSNGVTVTFAGNISDADSIIIFIAKDNTNITRIYPGNAASASISASDLASLPVVTDNSAIMEVVPYRVTVNSQGGKKYAFIKERAVTKTININ